MDNVKLIVSKLFIIVPAVWLSFFVGLAYADAAVIGQLRAESSLILNPGVAQQQIGKQSMPYIQGDVVSTQGGSGASVTLTSGKLSVSIAPDSLVSIAWDESIHINLTQGGVGFSVTDNNAVVINSPTGSFKIAADGIASAVAVFENGEVAIVSKRGELLVEELSGSVVTKLTDGKVFVSSANQSKIVEVGIGGGGGFGGGNRRNSAVILALLASAAAIAGIIISNDDDDNNNDGPAASPAN